jgi:hypothetical protein
MGRLSIPSAKLAASGVLLGVALWAQSNVEASPSPSPGTAPDGPSLDPVAPDLPGLVNTALLAQPRDDGGDLLRADPTRAWHLVSGRHWQIDGPRGEDAAITDAREGNRGSCGAGMIEVAGKMKMHAMLDEMQLQACTKWIDRKWPERCGEYDRQKWLQIAKDLPTQSMHFCIDRFEYPNRKNEYPIILVNWYEARDACKAENKRLCTEDEWTFACEGDEATPYPNGYVRDPDACINDRPWKQFHGEALSPRSGKAAMMELDRLWQGVASGTRAQCKSKFGVYDMTGNVDEWTRSSVPGERPSVLKGGYWGPVRTRCRPATKAHGEEHTFYQQGFRCCADTSTQ